MSSELTPASTAIAGSLTGPIMVHVTPSPYPGSFLGLDIGSKRIGVALADPSGLLASPLLTVYRTRPRDDLRSVTRLARRYGCSAFVAGLPLHMSGKPSAMSAKVESFVSALTELSGLPVHLWDERLSSSEAHAILYAAGRPRAEHAKVVDQLAAVLILQGFLDAQGETQDAAPPSTGAL